MLTNLITIWDSSLLPEWNKITASARSSLEEMRREDGILVLSYAMSFMGITSLDDSSDIVGFDLSQEEFDKQSNELSWDYPLFPNWDAIAFPWCNSNYMWGGARMCIGLKSKVSELAIFPFDFSEHSMHFQKPLTTREAVLSVVRLYESTAKGYAAYREGVRIDTVTATDEAELSRAISYGFVPEKLQSDVSVTITYAEFCELLSNLVLLYHKETLPDWQETASLALQSDTPMQRDDGAIALYFAASAMELANFKASFNLESFIGSDKWWSGVKFDYPLFPDWDQPWVDPRNGKQTDANLAQAAHWFVIMCVSSVDGSMLFDLDTDGQIYFGDDFSRIDAIQAALRLYESDWDVALQVDYSEYRSEQSEPYFAEADTLRSRILNSPTTVTYSGTAYYVSNNGDDTNDGKTPETAWATVSRVNQASLLKGDAVFFQRGGLWRCEEYLLCAQGVTYSAYGEGEKPVFTLSPEDGADASKWMLYYDGSNGEKIWVFHRNMHDCGNLYFNGGKSWAYKVAPHWRKGRWTNADGTEFDVTSQLYRNHAFFSCVDSALPKNDQIERIWFPDYITDGPLYLRCDEGNPGEVFDSIEFGCRAKGHNSSFLELQAGCTADNLCLRFLGTGGILPGNENGTIQNCEISWCGGAMLSDNTTDLAAPGNKDIVCVAGGGINVGGQNNLITNNYIHDMFQEGITLEGDYNGPQFNNRVNGNLIERTYNGILITHFDTDLDAEPFWNDVEVSDNIVVMSGFNWGNTQATQGYPMGSGLCIPEYPNTNRNLRIHDNLILGCYGWLFECVMTGATLPDIDHNTFCALNMNTLPFIDKGYIQYPAGSAEKYITEKFGNDSNQLIVFN